MSQSNAASRRNIAFIGQSGIGKTVLAEAILYSLGITTRKGVTVDGSSHFDFEPEEIKRGSTMKAAAFDFTTKQCSFSLLDTPGSTSFVVDTACVLRAADVAVLVIGGASNLKVQGEKAWKIAVNEGLARAIFVTELDRERANFQTAVDGAKKILGISPVVLQIPIGAEADFRGVVDLISKKAYITGEDGKTVVTDVPAELSDEVEVARLSAVESIAETDDVLVEKYLEGEPVTEGELLSALKKGFASGQIIPVLCGSGITGGGASALVAAAENFFPSPFERAPYLLKDAEGEKNEIAPDPDAPFLGILFKTFTDAFTGQVSLLRVVTGTLKNDDTVYNPNADIEERVGKLHVQLGKEQSAIGSAGPGEIVAIVKLKGTKTGHTLADKSKPGMLEEIEFPSASISYAIEPKNKGDEDKVHSAVEKMANEDPSIRIFRDPSTHQMLISGMGQNHIELTLQRIQRKFKVEVVLHAPQVPYRETITKKAEAQGKHKKQSGGRGQFGDCWLRINPKERGAGFEFSNDIFGGAIPKNYIPAVEKGVVEAMAKGCLAGYPMVDIQCSVYDGSYHAVDSSDMAFKIAASKGFRAAVAKAGPVLLEPIMQVSITCPEDCTGDIMGDLNSRRGKVGSMEMNIGSQTIHAEVPLSEMLSYAPSLRSITADRGEFSMEFHSYEQVPAHIADKVIEEAKKHATEEDED